MLTKFIFDNKKTIVTIVLLLCITPFFLISWYANPTDDDFCNASSVQQLGAWEYINYLYHNHTGRYTSSAILSYCNPLLQSNWSAAVKIYPMIYLALFYLSFYALISSFTKEKKAIYSLAIVSVILANLPSIASAFYWFTGFTVYTLGSIICLFFTVVLIKYNTTANKIYLMPLVILMIIAIGISELFIAITFIILSYSAILALSHSKKIPSYLLVLFVFFIGASLLTLTAPGNIARATTASSQVTQGLPIAFLKTALKNMYLVTSNITIWLTDIKFYLIIFLFIPVSLKAVKGSLFFKKEPPLILNIATIFLLTYSITFLPCLVDNEVLPRVWNIAYIFFVLSCIFSVHCYIQFNKDKVSSIYSGIPSKMHYFIWALLPLLLLLGGKSNINIAYIDYFAKAKEFDLRLRERYTLIETQKNNGVQNIKVEAIFDKTYKYPKTLYLSDITESPELYPNDCYGNFFGVKEISLIKSNRLEPYHMKESW